MSQNLFNPFREVASDETADLDLIVLSQQGDRIALEALILRHQSWIYNIAIRMVYDPLGAEDITQEVLIKIITKLSSYDPDKSAFRTWVYRIVANHVINAKRSRHEALMEGAIKGEQFEEFVSRLPVKMRTDREDRYREEVKMACVHCILLSLKRRERMIFILGVVFGVSDSMGSEVCEVSKANFRKILSRSRRRVYDFFQGNCGLLDERNPCRCSNNLNQMIKKGLVNPDDLLILKASHGSVRDIIAGSIRAIEDSYEEFNSLFRDQPFLKSPDMIRWLRDMLNRQDVKILLLN